MANLVITNGCNLSCPFCFATEYRCQPAVAACVTLEQFRQHVAFVADDTVRFCGGEPTGHPQFTAMLDFALERPKGRAFVMTNGLWPTPVRNHFLILPRKSRLRVTFLFNILEPSSYTNAQRSTLNATLAAVEAETVTLGMTMHTPTPQYAHLLALAERFGFGHVRYSIAAPNITDPTTWLLEPQKDFPILANTVVDLLRDSQSLGIRVQSDCGYLPPCVFGDKQLEDIRRSQQDISFRCHGPIDIGPDGQAWRCYGLFAMTRAPISDYKSIDQLQTDTAARTDHLGQHDLFDGCRTCAHRRDHTCGGGCYAFRVVRSMLRRARQRGFDITHDEELMATTPHIDCDTLAFFEHDGRAKWMLKELDTWSLLRLTSVEERILAACNGSQSLAEIAASIAPASSATLVGFAQAIRKLFALGAIELSR